MLAKIIWFKWQCIIALFQDTEVQPNREILAPPGVESEQDREQVLSIGKHPSLMKVMNWTARNIKAYSRKESVVN